MKQKYTITIEIPDTMPVVEEPGTTEEDYKGKEKELQKFRKDFAKGVAREIEKYFTDETHKIIDFFEDHLFLDALEEYTIEEWVMLEDYGIKISLKKS